MNASKKEKRHMRNPIAIHIIFSQRQLRGNSPVEGITYIYRHYIHTSYVHTYIHHMTIRSTVFQHSSVSIRKPNYLKKN